MHSGKFSKKNPENVVWHSQALKIFSPQWLGTSNMDDFLLKTSAHPKYQVVHLLTLSGKRPPPGRTRHTQWQGEVAVHLHVVMCERYRACAHHRLTAEYARVSAHTCKQFECAYICPRAHENVRT